MKTGERRLRGSHAALSIARLLTDLPVRSPRCERQKARLPSVITRLATPFVDLLLYGFSLLIRDDAPGIAITTFHELGDALASQHRAAHTDELRQEEVALD